MNETNTETDTGVMASDEATTVMTGTSFTCEPPLNMTDYIQWTLGIPLLFLIVIIVYGIKRKLKKLDISNVCWYADRIAGLSFVLSFLIFALNVWYSFDMFKYVEGSGVPILLALAFSEVCKRFLYGCAIAILAILTSILFKTVSLRDHKMNNTGSLAND